MSREKRKERVLLPNIRLWNFIRIDTQSYRVFIEKHSIKQKPYLVWKAEILPRLYPKLRLVESKAWRTFKACTMIEIKSRTFDYFYEFSDLRKLENLFKSHKNN
ncbi:MAG: hypothetical protein ACFFGZ_20245 [Candidatus Thorarchaeota archaeon]